MSLTPERLRYLRLLSAQYPTIQAASTKIINLNVILNLPKGTEHFISDIHGESEAFLHILNACSGEVKEKIKEVYASVLSAGEINDLATLVYYPRPKLALVADHEEDLEGWYRLTLHRLVQVCRYVSIKHTRGKVRSLTPREYEEIIDELIHIRDEDGSKRTHYDNIISTIIQIGAAQDVIAALCEVIKALTVDQLHIVGDIFDRGSRADIVMDSLMNCHSVDIQWGNHDILWMGAAAGSRTLVATVLANSLRYNNLDVIETGYGISLRPLSVFANDAYKHTDVTCFHVKELGEKSNEKDRLLSARMYKAIMVILFKLEGQKLLRHPEYGMADRLLLDKIDREKRCITLNGRAYPLRDVDFPTVSPENPYALTPEESQVIERLTNAFRHSEKLQSHVRFLYTKGGLYRVHNGNLLFHGCIPMTEDGQLMSFSIGGEERRGKAFLDFAEQQARRAYYAKRGSAEREDGMDFLWWLWTGRNSPIFGRDRMSTFERLLIEDENTWTEPKNPYYQHCQRRETCEMLLAEFGLTGAHCHIINGHVPVRVKKGESPIKGGGKLIVIDGGFSKAYQKTSGIAGYTLIFSSRHFRIVSHQPFSGKHDALYGNRDIARETDIFEKLGERMKVRETDEGRVLQGQVDDLMDLLQAYRSGEVTEGQN